MGRVELDDETYARVLALAERAGVTPEEIVRRAMQAEGAGALKDDSAGPNGT